MVATSSVSLMCGSSLVLKQQEHRQIQDWKGVTKMRSYIVVRIEKGKQDVRTHFPEDKASPVDAIRWCESDGYKVIGHEIIETPDDVNFCATVKVTVESRT
jgi:hypothetical protein